ncbi:MAG: hypothetical protein RDU20_09395 [Desulfomonilaceae bacterium]|nr:hypothetical protein [Desulfomonilaceae bacterium]
MKQPLFTLAKVATIGGGGTPVEMVQPRSQPGACFAGISGYTMLNW